MNIEELDDPRARELTRLAHRTCRVALNWLTTRHYRSLQSTAAQHFQRVAAREASFLRCLADYERFVDELEREARVGRGGWRNEGE